MESICKTPGYAAPELLMGTPYCEKVDMWSVGVIMYTLCVLLFVDIKEKVSK